MPRLEWSISIRVETLECGKVFPLYGEMVECLFESELVALVAETYSVIPNIKQSIVAMISESKLNDTNDACLSISSLDCGKCTTFKRVKIDGRARCRCVCSTNGHQCRRMEIEGVGMCLQHGVMMKNRLLCEIVESFVFPLDMVLKDNINQSNISFDSVEAIELLRKVYAMDTTIPLLRDIMPFKI